jgi:hypothetical protein
MTHHELPLPDYDQMPLGSIESRVRTLGEGGVRQLLDHERAHANRLAVVRLLEQRLVALNTGQAEPSGGSPIGETPEVNANAYGDSQPPMTEGPPNNPPSQGVPTNPAQPRR